MRLHGEGVKRAEWLAVACPDCEAPAGAECWSAIRRGRHLASGCHPDRRRVVLGTYVENHDRALRRMVDEVRAKVLRHHKA